MIPDSRIDYILVGLPRHRRGKVRWTAGGHCPGRRHLAKDHFAVVADLEQ